MSLANENANSGIPQVVIIPPNGVQDRDAGGNADDAVDERNANGNRNGNLNGGQGDLRGNADDNRDGNGNGNAGQEGNPRGNAGDDQDGNGNGGQGGNLGGNAGGNFGGNPGGNLGQNNIVIRNLQPRYQFPMHLAIQCIPEFKGSADELEPFLVQISYFAEQIPQGGNQVDLQRPLLNIVLMKLKGKASSFINRIKSDTWAEMIVKLRRIFGHKITSEEILQKIETLEQGFKESFADYADRALRIQECIDEFQEEELLRAQHHHAASFACRSLRIHFIAGLRNANLKQVAKAQQVPTFRELVEILEAQHKECEQLEHIEQRLQTCRVTKNSQYSQNFRSEHRNPANNNRNQNSNYAPNRNFNNQRNFNGQNFNTSSRPQNTGSFQNRGNYNQGQQNNFQHQRNYNQPQNTQGNPGPSNWNNRRFDESNVRAQNNTNYNQRKN